ncbi:MAG: hypothetical protein GXO48_05475 [Chlorobi bacterium]|nr:hypothetical protein [Chlorobiota bacterium]
MSIIVSRRLGRRIRPIVRALMEYYARQVLKQPLHYDAYLEQDQAQYIDSLVSSFQREYKLRKKIARKSKESREPNNK